MPNIAPIAYWFLDDAGGLADNSVMVYENLDIMIYENGDIMIFQL